MFYASDINPAYVIPNAAYLTVPLNELPPLAVITRVFRFRVY